MTRMGTCFVMVENLFRGHPPGEQPEGLADGSRWSARVKGPTTGYTPA